MWLIELQGVTPLFDCHRPEDTSSRRPDALGEEVNLGQQACPMRSYWYNHSGRRVSIESQTTWPAYLNVYLLFEAKLDTLLP